ncbi:MBL fold metallo-hydrolase [Kitasatospora viridis]|uniref:L-ascorbate metabolism protein UlaG (Beta-lactamase superfamily) n=1 Tax=Kitasatospora viridis TaxID=281105 RepID=A0A561T747_9ACTN|nr:MBL fold metallo-hydrolase [Kitasatospora viridis]TWF82946.1 L-ascorbate metabolism protein UlaG (beta-lactamase superfamily) [Kitasatospora viridis]
MRITSHGHACVRIEAEGRVLVIDPGIFSDASALDGADEVLVTHEHPDHLDLAKLLAARAANPRLRVLLPAPAAEQAAELGSAAVVVAPGEQVTAAGFTVDVVGGQHAEIYDALPGCANVGFVVDRRLYHPGDSLFVPEQPVEAVLVPAAAPWLKLAEALDFVRAVKPARAFPIHDATLNALGREYFDGWMDFKGETAYTRLAAGEAAEL